MVSTYFAEGLPVLDRPPALGRSTSRSLGSEPGGRRAHLALRRWPGTSSSSGAPLVESLRHARRWLVACEALLGLVVMAMAGARASGDLGGVSRACWWPPRSSRRRTTSPSTASTSRRSTSGRRPTLSGLRVAAYRAAHARRQRRSWWCSRARTSWRSSAVPAWPAPRSSCWRARTRWRSRAVPAEAAAPAAAPRRCRYARRVRRRFLRQPRIGVSLAVHPALQGRRRADVQHERALPPEPRLRRSGRGARGHAGHSWRHRRRRSPGGAAIARLGLSRDARPIAVGAEPRHPRSTWRSPRAAPGAGGRRRRGGLRAARRRGRRLGPRGLPDAPLPGRSTRRRTSPSPPR